MPSHACRVRQLLLLAWLAGTVQVATVASASQGGEGSTLRIRFTGDQVSIEARDVSLQRLVEDVARRAGIRLVLEKYLDRRVSVELQHLPLPQALGRILRGEDYALNCDRPVCTGAGPAGGRRGTLRVFAEPGAAGSADLAVVERAGRVEHLTPLLAASDAVLREDTVERLADLGGSESIPALSLALGDTDAKVRAAAIAALADIGNDDAAQALAVALNDPSSTLREDAVDALGEIGGSTAQRLLQHALADPDNIVREAAMENLRAQRDQHQAR